MKFHSDMRTFTPREIDLADLGLVLTQHIWNQRLSRRPATSSNSESLHFEVSKKYREMDYMQPRSLHYLGLAELGQDFSTHFRHQRQISRPTMPSQYDFFFQNLSWRKSMTWLHSGHVYPIKSTFPASNPARRDIRLKTARVRFQVCTQTFLKHTIKCMKMRKGRIFDTSAHESGYPVFGSRVEFLEPPKQNPVTRVEIPRNTVCRKIIWD
jgi:hypothetical protein